MEIENIQKVLIKKKKPRISIPDILVIVWGYNSQLMGGSRSPGASLDAGVLGP